MVKDVALHNVGRDLLCSLEIVVNQYHQCRSYKIDKDNGSKTFVIWTNDAVSSEQARQLSMAYLNTKAILHLLSVVQFGSQNARSQAAAEEQKHPYDKPFSIP